MKHFSLFIGFLFFVLALCAQNSDSQYFYVGTYTSEGAEGIYLCKLDQKTGDISLINTFSGMDNPSFLRLSPDNNYLYAVSETAKGDGKTGFVHAYKVGKDGNLSLLNSEESVGDNPCHVDVSPYGTEVLVSNYSSGTFSLFSVKKDGSLTPASQTIVNKGSGPNKDRQETPHAHSAKFSPFTDEVFNADLGTDQLNIYHLNDGGLVQVGQAYVKITPGAGPRHFDFHPNGNVIYVINELNSTISALKKEGKNWVVFQNISTLPDDFNGESYCADIHISNDGNFLYGSNRGHNSIAVFQVEPDDQSLRLLETVSVEGNWPRNFGITPDGSRMLVANQRSHNITVFNIDRQTGKLKYSGNEIELPAPVCIEFWK